uniref:Cytochrome b5 heme-binding domain-containing protein n=1 Tax=Chromera velia CCMP2878 TaxID=1169474 RepID=A0A0G4HE65_9ALVE|mmetsp:Transcript_22103/g.43844  ORF Transcript_22103/g.43844 Transcript_22103/m.43844 type:complete len:147 (+) Transcript_22103:206-646(+)|eukprot:Cvel_26678.t1-p1 / transcript=Cvel_26678.t1 / gene=Cvel_26678 / organism=Chromera_velia_CCMP2878 / gene_product=Cytochrome b5, putative / transcript_product=Cytochrome b5, putative / location=Cvel_scaffold3212:16777-18504(-) / protein_length=146 / sequence_SO=supercontig / SO=protein_coding / is_pseudo=false
MAESYAKKKNLPTVTKKELEKHKTERDCWIALHGIVYDVTKFLPDHPGGPEIVVGSAGRDATEEFEEVSHSENARFMAAEYEVGVLEGSEGTATGPLVSEDSQVPTKKGPLNAGLGSSWLLPAAVVVAGAAVAFFVIQSKRASSSR